MRLAPSSLATDSRLARQGTAPQSLRRPVMTNNNAPTTVMSYKIAKPRDSRVESRDRPAIELETRPL
jgi:hypothetical protein